MQSAAKPALHLFNNKTHIFSFGAGKTTTDKHDENLILSCANVGSTLHHKDSDDCCIVQKWSTGVCVNKFHEKIPHCVWKRHGEELGEL